MLASPSHRFHETTWVLVLPQAAALGVYQLAPLSRLLGHCLQNTPEQGYSSSLDTLQEE